MIQFLYRGRISRYYGTHGNARSSVPGARLKAASRGSLGTGEDYEGGCFEKVASRSYALAGDIDASALLVDGKSLQRNAAVAVI